MPMLQKYVDLLLFIFRCVRFGNFFCLSPLFLAIVILTHEKYARIYKKPAYMSVIGT